MFWHVLTYFKQLLIVIEISVEHRLNHVSAIGHENFELIRRIIKTEVVGQS